MKAIEITQYGAPEVLRAGERPDPVAGAGEVLIRVSASGVNRPDVLQRTGNYPVPPGASDIPGLEVAGTIVGGDAAAMAAAGFKAGDRICAQPRRFRARLMHSFSPIEFWQAALWDWPPSADGQP